LQAFALWSVVGETDAQCSTKERTVWRINDERLRLAIDHDHPALDDVDVWDVVDCLRLIAAELTEPGCSGLSE
jgi:hypothetical protein